MKKFIPAILLTLIIFLAVAVRLAPIVFERDYWYDEAFTGVLLKEPWGEMNQMIFDDVHPPLYYWLAKPWAAVFNYSPIGIRTFSLALGIATVISLYWIGKKMFNHRRAGLLAATLAAFSPFAIQYSQEARMYSLFGFLFVWAVWFFYRALETDRLKYWIFWGIFSGLSFYTHYLSLFFFIMFYLTLVVYQKMFKEKSFFRSILGTKYFWLGTGIIFVFFLSWIKVFYVHMMKGNLGWIGVSYLSDIPKTLQIFFFGHPPGTGGVPSSNDFLLVEVGENIIHKVPLFDEYSIGIAILLFLAILATLAWTKKLIRKEILILSMMSLGTLLFLILLSFFNIKLYVSRYFLPAAVLIYLLTAGLIITILQSRWSWLIVLTLYTIFIVLLGPVTYFYGWNEISKNQSVLLSEKTIVVAGNPFDYTTARYYFGKERVRFYNKNNPEESFDWVLVKDESRIKDINELKKLEDVRIIDETCDWEDVELRIVGMFGQLSICKLKK